ncbi:carbohydrate porin [Rhodanobacter sp. Si-c]|uniref:Carbohydrate porin n=1 Tax=Rhodanobacter lycopersici TaxID=3162487 RepID=A0ABV3QFM5_9GAMM
MGHSKATGKTTGTRGRITAACLIVLACYVTANAHAQTQTQDPNTATSPVETPTDWLHDTGFLGDWGGERTQLSNDGYNFFGNLQSQTSSITHGGKKRGTATTYQVVAGTTLNLDKLMGIPGGNFTFAVSDRFGSNASNWAGTKVIIDSNYGEGENFRLANLSFRQSLLKGRLSYQVGYFPAAAEFDYSPILCGLLNQGFCGHPNSLAADSSGIQNPPGAQMGARVTGFILPDVYLKVGAFKVIPRDYVNNAYGFHLGTGGATGNIYLSELGWDAKLGEQGLVGHYKIGGYYDTSDAPDVVDTSIQRKGRTNGWLAIDQMVYGIGPDAKRGLVLFLNLTEAGRSNEQIQSYNSAGFVFLGPFASRPDDILSLGWAKSDINGRILAAERQRRPDVRYYDAEKYIDLSYHIQLTPWLFITPDVQYLMDPGVYSKTHYPNAIVVGGELAIKF